MRTFESAWEQSRQIHGWLNQHEAELLWDASETAILTHKGRLSVERVPLRLPSILEIGSFKGKSSILFMDRGADVTLVDPFLLGSDARMSPVPNPQVKSELRANLGEFVYCLLPVTSECAAKILGFTRFDFIYFDGDHTEKGIGQDVGLFLPKLHPGGFAAFHDYADPDYPAVSKAVDAIDWPIWGKADSMIVKRKPSGVSVE